jgi:signal transduction histidine kinase
MFDYQPTVLIVEDDPHIRRFVRIVMFYLLAVVGVALRHGRGPAALASVVSVPLFDYFFVQPISSFAVSDVQYVLTFAVLLGVGLLIGQLTAGLRVQAETSVKREADARALYEFARELSSALQSEQIVQAAETFLKAAFDADSALYILGLDDRLRLAASCGMAPEPALAQWVQDHGQPAGAGTRTLANSPLLYLPLAAPMRVRGVLVLRTARPVAASPAAWRQAQAYATLIAIAVERLHYVEVAQQALLNVESEKLRNSLLAAVSHDLRTPLTGLIGMTETLARGSPDAATQEQALAIRDQARRMHLMVVNLLDMARLQSHGAPLKREWQSIEELVGAALATMRETLRAHRLRVLPLSDLPHDSPSHGRTRRPAPRPRPPAAIAAAGGTGRAPWPPAYLFRRLGRRGQDLRHAGRRARPDGPRHRCAGRRRRNPWPPGNPAAARRPAPAAAQAAALPRPRTAGVRSGRRPAAPPRTGAARRACPQQCAGGPARQALAGRARPAARRDRRMDHA